jgi:dihydroxyacetone kinase
MTIKEAFVNIDKEINNRESEITQYDQKVGDGDHALNLQRGFNSIIPKLKG